MMDRRIEPGTVVANRSGFSRSVPVEALLTDRSRHPTCGAKKLFPILLKRYPECDFPSRSTLCDILKRNGLVPNKCQPSRIGHPGKPSTRILAPNELGDADASLSIAGHWEIILGPKGPRASMHDRSRSR